MNRDISITPYARKARLLRLVFEMKKKGIPIEFASHPCFQKSKHD